MRYFAKDPGHFLNDRFVLSKGHAAPLLYAAHKRAGYLSDEQIMSLRSIHSNVEGHPTTDMPFVDVATGSLGQGLGVSCGLAYSIKYFE
jgi:transketolase